MKQARTITKSISQEDQNEGLCKAIVLLCSESASPDLTVMWPENLTGLLNADLTLMDGEVVRDDGTVFETIDDMDPAPFPCYVGKGWRGTTQEKTS